MSIVLPVQAYIVDPAYVDVAPSLQLGAVCMRVWWWGYVCDTNGTVHHICTVPLAHTPTSMSKMCVLILK